MACYVSSMKPERILEYRPAEIAQAFGLKNVNKAKFNLQHGTAFSFWLQARLEEEFNLTRRRQCEFRTLTDAKVVVRMLTRTINFAQSISHGGHRPFIAVDFLDFLASIPSYLVVDLRAYEADSEVWRFPVYRVPIIAVKYWWNMGLLKVPVTIAEAVTKGPTGTIAEIKTVTTFRLNQARRHFAAFDELNVEKTVLEAVFDRMYLQSKDSLKNFKAVV